MSNKSLFALIAAVVVVVLAWNSLYIVTQTEKAVLLRFGKIENPDVQPGLHVKIPVVNQVRSAPKPRSSRASWRSAVDSITSARSHHAKRRG